MKSKNLSGVNISALRNEKGNICISVIVPTHRLSPQRKSDETELNKSLDKARQLLLSKYPDVDTNAILKRLDELAETIDFAHNLEGLGLYISPALSLLVKFPFPVQERVMVKDSFELRELLYMENYSNLYYVLLLSEQGGRLFNGSGDSLFEIKDSHFPMVHTDAHAYSKPAHSSSYAGYAHEKNYEKDKSEMKAIRLKDFFRKLDKALDNYLSGDAPLIVMGVKKELSLFAAVTHHLQKIIDKIPGNYHYDNEKQLADMAWPAMRLHLENSRKALVKEFEEKIGERLGVSGIQDIWTAAMEGKAFRLLVEKDYRHAGFAGENGHHLYLHPPKLPNRVVIDAVDDIIETVLEKNGQVYFVDNGVLKDHHRMALITRY
jgi:hypothetical protein